MTRICVIGDLHLSERSPRYEHTLAVLDQVLEHGQHLNAQAYIFCGDIFEGDPSPAEYHEVLQRLYRLIKRSKLVFVIRGNHESYDAYRFFELLSPMIEVAWDTLVTFDLEDARLLLIPYPVRYRPPFHDVSQDTIAGSMQDTARMIADAVRGAADSVPKDQRGVTRPLVVFGHFTIEGMTTRDTEFERHSANEVVVPLAAFAPATLTKVGHIHRAQQLTPAVGSVGDLVRCSFAEADDPKIFAMISVEDGKITDEPVPSPCRGMREFSVELDDLQATLPTIEAAATQGLEIKVVVGMNATETARYNPAVFDTVRATAPYFLLEKDVRAVQRLRAPALQANMDLREEFLVWAGAVGIELSGERQARIDEKLRELV